MIYTLSCVTCVLNMSVYTYSTTTTTKTPRRSIPMKFHTQRHFDWICKWLKIVVWWLNSKSSRVSELCIQQLHISRDSQSFKHFFVFRLRLSCVDCKNASSKYYSTLQQMSQFKRDCSIRLKEANYMNRIITWHLCQSDVAIKWCWQEWVNNSRYQDQNGSGRPRATIKQEDREIVRTAVKHHIPRDQLSTMWPIHICPTWSLAYDREQNLCSHCLLWCLPLTPVHHWVWLKWCHAWSTKNCADWGCIVFSDESCFQLYPEDNLRCVLRHPG